MASLQLKASTQLGRGRKISPSPAPHPKTKFKTSKAEVSTWLRSGTFYLALTGMVCVETGRLGLSADALARLFGFAP
jgi:hypothetical protein